MALYKVDYRDAYRFGKAFWAGDSVGGCKVFRLNLNKVKPGVNGFMKRVSVDSRFALPKTACVADTGKQSVIMLSMVGHGHG